MGEKSNIEWTDASWNPVTGCSKVSPGCANCYAETLSLRMGWSHQPWTPANAAENVILHPERLDLPLRWRGNKRIFVNSMSDLFHEQVPDSFIAAVFQIMAKAPQHTFQVLTKRPERMRSFLQSGGGTILSEGMQYLAFTPPTAVTDRFIKTQLNGNTAVTVARVRDTPELWPLKNVWCGTSVENQHWADVRIPLLLDTPAAVRFLSCEPLLGPVDLSRWLGIYKPEEARRAGTWDALPWYKSTAVPINRLHWIITGGESGPNFRPFNPDWAQQIRDQCVAAEVAYFHKQHGGRTPKSGGRLLDGRTWNEMPEVRA